MSRLVDVSGARLFVQEVGDGPPMLLMHGGLGLDHSSLRAHDALSDVARLVYYDHRGNGRSTREPLAGVDVARWCDDAAELLDALALRDAVIYGHSFGGCLALAFALRHPARTRALVLSAATAAFDYVDQIVAHIAVQPPELAAAFTRVLTTPPGSDDAYRAAWHEILPLYVRDSARLPAVRASLAATHWSAAAYAASLAAVATYDVTARLGELRCPLLLLSGSHDFMSPPSQARRIAAGAVNAGVEIVELPGCGHFLHAEQPEAYVAAVRTWLQRL